MAGRLVTLTCPEGWRSAWARDNGPPGSCSRPLDLKVFAVIPNKHQGHLAVDDECRWQIHAFPARDGVFELMLWLAGGTHLATSDALVRVHVVHRQLQGFAFMQPRKSLRAVRRDQADVRPKRAFLRSYVNCRRCSRASAWPKSPPKPQADRTGNPIHGHATRRCKADRCFCIAPCPSCPRYDMRNRSSVWCLGNVGGQKAATILSIGAARPSRQKEGEQEQQGRYARISGETAHKRFLPNGILPNAPEICQKCDAKVVLGQFPVKGCRRRPNQKS